MKLQFIGANHEVTGSCHYLQAGDSYMLVDYGMEQGVNRFENCRCRFRNPRSILCF